MAEPPSTAKLPAVAKLTVADCAGVQDSQKQKKAEKSGFMANNNYNRLRLLSIVPIVRLLPARFDRLDWRLRLGLGWRLRLFAILILIVLIILIPPRCQPQSSHLLKLVFLQSVKSLNVRGACSTGGLNAEDFLEVIAVFVSTAILVLALPMGFAPIKEGLWKLLWR